MNISDNSAGTLEVFGRLLDSYPHPSLRRRVSLGQEANSSKLSIRTFWRNTMNWFKQYMGGTTGEIVDELGDLLFLVVFLAYMFEQEGLTILREIIEGVVAKMIRRHPHVFGDARVKGAEEVIENWSKIKASEENIRERESLLDGIPRSLPALSRAQKLAARAARVGFDWTGPQEVFAKVDEELSELKHAVDEGSVENIHEELGDLLFVVVNAARHLKVNSEAALNETSDKFERRFRHIEARLATRGQSLDQADLQEMDELWDEAKSREKQHNLSGPSMDRS